MPDNVADSARTGARDGLDNLLYAVGSIEHPPTELAGVADLVTVLFPWGSLLRAVARADVAALVGLARPGAAVDMLLNASVFDDPALCERLQLGDDLVHRPDALATAYARAGIELDRIEAVTPPLPYVTTWGQKLAVSGRRAVLRLQGRVASGRLRVYCSRYPLVPSV